MVNLFDWRQFKWDSRGGKIEKYKIVTGMDYGTALVVECPEWIAGQLAQSFGGHCKPGNLSEKSAEEYSHGFIFRDGVPEGTEAFLDSLTRALSIPCPTGVDVAVALDWYNQPDDEGSIKRTDAGYWIYTTKYATQPTWTTSRKSRREMITALVEFIQTHPLYSDAAAIIAAPGHLADGQSFGEVMAREVSERVGIPFIETSSQGPREQQKETIQDLTNTFTVTERLHGAVIVLDDVFHTGGSASGEAAAARRAGAERVYVLTVARTISR